MSEKNDQIKSRVETITPVIASKLLERNTHNRRLNENYVLSLAQDILDDRYQLNGEAIVIASDGTVHNGQHRLHAVILAGKPIESIVVRGVDPATFESVDSGMGRTGGHVLGIEGRPCANTFAATANLLYAYLNDKLQAAGRARRLRHTQLLDFLKDHPRLEESVKVGVQLQRVMSSSVAGMMHYIYAAIDREAADNFFQEVLTGENLRKSQPTYQLRARMLENRASKAKLDYLSVLALTIKAINAYHSGEDVKVLRYTIHEDFPKLTFTKKTRAKRTA